MAHSAQGVKGKRSVFGFSLVERESPLVERADGLTEAEAAASVYLLTRVAGWTFCLPGFPQTDMLRFLLFIAFLFGLVWQVAAQTQALTLEHRGLTREYRLRVPDGYDGQTPLPLLLAFHGGFGTSLQFELETRFSQLADTAGLFVVYPQAYGSTRSWNTGTCCGWAYNNGVNDIAFVDTLLDVLLSQYAIDANRIYSTGFSSGAMFTYALACNLPHRLAAVSPVGSSMIIGECEPGCVPVPLQHLHSLPDSSALYLGGLTSNPLLQNVLYPPVDSVLAAWRLKNGLFGNSEIVFTHPKATGRRWTGGYESAEMRLYLSTDGGHKWMGTEGDGILSGDTATKAFSATQLVWDFCRTKTKACAVEVWPGDANDDDAVSVADYFFAAGAYGRTGAARPVNGITWQGYLTGGRWATDSAFQGVPVNDRVLDANGDGTITLFDVAVTVLNRGLSH